MGFIGFKLRIALCVFLVLLTYNPSGWSYVHWVANGFDVQSSLKVLGGILLVIAYAVVFRATLRSIGFLGVGLVVALLAAIGWVMVDLGVIDINDSGLVQWLVLIAGGLVLGVGLSWSHVRRAITGQVDMDDVEEG